MSSKPYKGHFKPFTYKNIEELRDEFERLDLDVPICKNIEILKKSIRFGENSIPNRLSVQPMEGFDANGKGSPSKLTFRRYKRYAKSGVSLIWFESTSISLDSRSNPHQLMLTEKNKQDFRRLVNETRVLCNKTLESLGFRKNCFLILQLNHSGRYSKKSRKKNPIRASKNEELDKAIDVTEDDGKVVSDDELKNLENIWV
ncbi:MAG: hypothetical protein EU521_00150, partial [Promethearchaeota archaeon]